jgi:hypothetical protein
MTTIKDLERENNIGSIPIELKRLEKINLWGITHSTFRAAKGLNPCLPKIEHVYDAWSLARDLTENKIIVGGVAVHDVNTTGGTCHFDRELNGTEVKVLCNEIRGKGPFKNSTLPEWIDCKFGKNAHEIIAKEIEQKGVLYKITEGIENLSHIIFDTIPDRISKESYMEIKRKTKIDEEKGGIAIPKSILIQPYDIPIKDFLTSMRQVPLNAYALNKAGVFYEGILRDMMESVIERYGRDIVYLYDDDQWCEIFSKMRSLNRIRKQTLEVLKTRKLPIEDNGIVCYNNIYAQLSAIHNNSILYESFKKGKKRSLRTQIEKELSKDIGTRIYIVAIENAIGEEYIHINGEDNFPELRQLLLNVYGSHIDKKPSEVSEYIRKRLLSSNFGPLVIVGEEYSKKLSNQS